MPENDLLKDQLDVARLQPVEQAGIKNKLSGLVFQIPMKGDVSQRSGLNTSFGQGRGNVQGFYIPRSWYEVEIIVPKEITSLPGYPQADPHGEGGSFEVITDDGWKFKCKVSGDYSKNLRSESDLKILGKWLKGRLENAGVLRPGERVTDETLANYGRDNVTLTKLNNGNVWYMDFGVHK